MLLETLMSGSEDNKFEKAIMTAQKPISPKRPSQHLYDIYFHGDGAGATCEWEHVLDSYIGGFANGAELKFSSVQDAKCECTLMGITCGGITCETQDAGTLTNA